MTQNNDDRISVVPEISPAGNELPRTGQQPEHAGSEAAQGPAPVVVGQGNVDLDLAGQPEALSAAEVAAMTGGEQAVAANQALDAAEGREDKTQS
ncbi:hypothetical protein Deipr_0110 [Deinococcus proteolyticus MRP]|uniref:Uncharacterized protein n=1 Tax=Deinococcus proteolyticus (strain ATCC 35074 / DSM 20540 / JCM 6276 / NBRC 101906 / NCIMB 13154 / VKM Ac-1939 / CCM 2703 / MRP) TaxID=693977 RepID=F0RNQ2_DEIPM|nr:MULTISPECIES: hypothetical protein [Deinococcus]ADY25285.1 hypothetical protein Deipr_0110 [Deinococcus proteolyticus MRP]MCY1703386.1 hypothetical protein [Deinococcus sp. SL84]